MVGFDQIAGLWEDGERRLREASEPLQDGLERVVAELMVELERRVGSRFTAEELASYYLSEGTDWCYRIAYRTAPGTPDAWDVSTVAGTAFHRYVRRATDYGGGMRQALEDEED
ncbi:MAG: hypothetical protein ACRDKL_00980 [Solirubrobacteraceae bacterium]